MSGDLCEEVIVEIFTRLPTKSLLRFRSVSKGLCACIGTCDFIRLHTSRSPNKALIIHDDFVEESCTKKNLYTLHSKDQLSPSSPYVGITAVEYPFDPYRIVGSCNGILCVGEYPNTIHLWNPSIRRKLTVHGPTPSWSDSKSRPIIGFGFDPTIDDYKILMIPRSNAKDGAVKSSYLYTMKTDTWREIASPATPYTIQCLYNGSLHWVVRGQAKDSPDDHLSSDYILAFDLRSEFFSKIELPGTIWGHHQVTVVNGCLAVISLNFEIPSSNSDNCLIWVRKEYDNTADSWSMAFKLNMKELYDRIYVYQLNADDDLLLHTPFAGILAYNPETQVYSRLKDWNYDSCTVVMFTCVESLELLDKGSSCDQVKEYDNRYNRYIRDPIDVYQLTADDDILLNANCEGIIVYNPETQVYSRIEDLNDDSVTVDMSPCVESLELSDKGSSCDQGKQITEQ